MLEMLRSLLVWYKTSGIYLAVCQPAEKALKEEVVIIFAQDDEQLQNVCL